VDAPSLVEWAALRARLTGDPAVPGVLAAAAARHHEAAMAFGRAVAERRLATIG
jgi:hypothetical protein